MTLCCKWAWCQAFDWIKRSFEFNSQKPSKWKLDQLTEVVFRRVFYSHYCIYFYMFDYVLFNASNLKTYKYLHAVTLIRTFHVFVLLTIVLFLFVFSLRLSLTLSHNVVPIYIFVVLFVNTILLLFFLFFLHWIFLKLCLCSALIPLLFVMFCVCVCFTFPNQKCTHSKTTTKYNDQTV